MALLSAADFPDILLLLSPDLTTDDVPPAILASNAFLWSAEQEVLALDEDAETRTGDDYTAVRQAARCFAAARLAGTLSDVTEERYPVYSIRVANPDRQAQAANLRLDAYRYIARVLDVRLVDLLAGTGGATQFTRACGNRGEIPF